VAPDLESLLGRLIRGDVEFVVVGGFAAVAHGASLLTQDLEVCCAFRAKEAMGRDRDRDAVLQPRAIRERVRGGQG